MALQNSRLAGEQTPQMPINHRLQTNDRSALFAVGVWGRSHIHHYWPANNAIKGFLQLSLTSFEQGLFALL